MITRIGGLKAALFAVSLTSLLAGCNQPAVSLKPPAFQDSASNVRDWDLVADKIVGKLAAQRAATAGTPGYSYFTRPIYVHSTAPR